MSTTLALLDSAQKITEKLHSSYIKDSVYSDSGDSSDCKCQKLKNQINYANCPYT